MTDSYVLAVQAIEILIKEEKPRSTASLAEELNCSPHTLSKVLQTLRRTDLIECQSGPLGGSLIKQETVTLYDIHLALGYYLPKCPTHIEHDKDCALCKHSRLTIENLRSNRI